MSIRPAGFFLLRTPALPFGRWLDWTKHGGELPAEVMEGVYLASPSLYQAVRRGDERKREMQAGKLASFFARAAGRPTPFGSFAGFAVGSIGNDSAIELAPESNRLDVRLDYRWSLAACHALQDDPALRDRIGYIVNPTLWRAGDEFRYLEPFADREHPTRVWFRAVNCEVTAYLAHLLEQAREPGTRAEWAERLARFTNARVGRCRTFIDELVESGVLVADFRPPVTEPDPAQWLLEKLSDWKYEGPLRECLESAVAALKRSPSVEELEQVEQSLRVAIAGGPSTPFFANLVTATDQCQLGKRVVDKIREGVELLHRLFPPSSNFLADFRRRFVERYERREVPLLEALDEETGIAIDAVRSKLPPELQAAAPLPQSGRGPEFRARDAALLAIVAEALQGGRQSIELTDANIKALENPDRGPLLESFSMFACILAPSQDAVNGGDFELALHGYAESGRVLGRFASVSEPLRAQLQSLIDTAEPDTVYAEVVHYPAGQALNNIVTRPALTSHEIPFFAHSTRPVEQQITLSDLVVSVRDGRVVLRSLRLNREVRPVMHNAHTFRKPGQLRVYRFLNEVRMQDTVDAPVWRWGVMESLPFLPRITHRGIILAPARWRLESSDVLQSPNDGESSFTAQLQRWRTGHRVPRFVLQAFEDQKLPIDLENPVSARSLYQHVKRGWPAHIEENLAAEDKLWVRGGGEAYQAEFVVPFICPRNPVPAAQALDRAPAVRRFAPGSEWVYAKLYGHAVASDRLLTRVLHPLVRDLEGDGSIDRWFFLRYADPDDHLRVRFHLTAGASRTRIETAFAKALYLEYAQRVTFDTYERELERYPNIEAAECFFHADSRCVLDLVRAQALPPHQRWMLALPGIDVLLEDFGLDLQARRDLVSQLRNGFRKEFRVGQSQARAAGDLYRAKRAEIENIFRRSRGLFAGRSRDAAPFVEMLAAPQTMADLIHLFINRMVRTAQRRQELVIYDLLVRSYDALLHQRKVEEPVEAGVLVI